MTPEKQRIKIAEACGLQQVSPKDWSGWDLGGMEMPGDMPNMVKVPDYLNDLNAMHSAERVLTKDQWEDYLQHLQDLIYPKELPTIGERLFEAEKMMTHAPSAQRAEAFLRCLSLWEE